MFQAGFCSLLSEILSQSGELTLQQGPLLSLPLGEYSHYTHFTGKKMRLSKMKCYLSP